MWNGLVYGPVVYAYSFDMSCSPTSLAQANFHGTSQVYSQPMIFLHTSSNVGEMFAKLTPVPLK